MARSTPPPIRLLLVDDHNVVRAGLAAVLGFDARLKVVAQAESADESLIAFRAYRPNVTIMDVRLPRVDGIEAARRIRKEFPEARLLMLSTFDAEEEVRRALDAGATGYALKSIEPEELIEAIIAVHRGERWLSPGLTKRIGVKRPIVGAFSPRQREVLELLSLGLSNKEIANALGITEDGAKAHLKGIFIRLGVDGRTQAVIAAMQRGLIRLEKNG